MSTRTSPHSHPAWRICPTPSCCPTSAAPPSRCAPRWRGCAPRTRWPWRTASHPPALCQPGGGERCLGAGHSDMATDEAAAASKQQPLLVLGKITEILDAFSLSRPSMSLGEIQQATGLPTSTVQRLVEQHGGPGSAGPDGRSHPHRRPGSYWAATATEGPRRACGGQPGSQGDPRQDRRDGVLLQGRSRTTGSASRSPKLITRCVATCTWARSFRCMSAPHRGSCWRGIPISPTRSWAHRWDTDDRLPPSPAPTSSAGWSPGQGRRLRDHGGRTRGLGVRSVGARLRRRRRRPGCASRSADRPSACRRLGVRRGSTSRSVTPSRSPGRSAAVFRSDCTEELLGGRLAHLARRGVRHGFPCARTALRPIVV